MSGANVYESLKKAVEVTLNPYVEPEERRKAIQFCEEFRETSLLPVRMDAGVTLAHRDNTHVVRKFGLQLLEHVIKYQWNQLSTEQKLFIKDSLSRLLVEMAKREWPQQWPTMLSELSSICSLGARQMELVLRFFLRLVEDVALFQTLEAAQRRRDIFQALTAEMETIFGFFLRTISEQFIKLKEIGCSKAAEAPEQVYERNVIIRILDVALETAGAYVEWIPVGYIVMEQGCFINICCQLLLEPSLRLKATDCLFQLVSRKGKVEVRRPSLILFEEGHLQYIMSSIQCNSSNSQMDPDSYQYLKSVSQLISGMTTQLCMLIGKEKDLADPPSTFPLFLEIALILTEHASHVISSHMASAWQQLFSHPQLSASQYLLACIPKWIELAVRHTWKTGFRSRNNSPSCEFSRLDFDTDEAFFAFLTKVRIEIHACIRTVGNLAPLLTFQFLRTWITALLNKSSDSLQEEDITREYPMNSEMPLHLEWESLSAILDHAIPKIMASPNSPKPLPEDGIQLLRMCLAFTTRDPLILSSWLSCISALFLFVPYEVSLLPETLTKIFGAVVFTLPNQAAKGSRSKSVRNVRRHACSLLVKLSVKYPETLFPVFESIFNMVKELSKEESKLSQMEKLTLAEVLLILSNKWCHYDKQTQFIGALLEPTREQWMAVTPHLSSCLSFMSFVGLDHEPVEPSDSDLSGKNRALLTDCIQMIFSVVKRCTWPENIDAARLGGFVRSEDQTTLCNPAAPHILPLLPGIFHFMGVIHLLWHPEAFQKFSSGYKKSFCLLDVEKHLILGTPHVETAGELTRSPLERMQQFLSSMHESCCHILGNAAATLGKEFFAIPNLVGMVINESLAGIDCIEDHWLRRIVRVFLRSFFTHCPPSDYLRVVVPILSQLLPYMLTRLSQKWENGSTAESTSPAFSYETPDTREMLEDQLLRQRTREYIDLLRAILFEAESGSQVTETNDAMEDGSDGSPSPRPLASLSESGLVVLNDSNLRPVIFLTLLRALTWGDAPSSSKASMLTTPVMKHLAATGAITESEAKSALQAILGALEVHGQHDNNQAFLMNLLLNVYDALRPSYPALAQFFLQIPGNNLEEVQKMDDRFLNWNPKYGKPEKVKKDMLKRLVTPIIGKNVGELGKRPVLVKDLPMMRPTGRKPQLSLDEMERRNLGLCGLFQGHESSSSSPSLPQAQGPMQI
ncbi:unnamed protein product [Darwinula stevensoni]|uniref:Importin N-terminal domain-containing protein n=1 Tax=Darwinula stevensoni TaxID=69355 RepID=A0A7R8X9Q3_9CRUS|nr:unnamed protein product [Darwinula stevensoni]CAG0891346.1 unnamed protein product [Darwinula stevensoni]